MPELMTVDEIFRRLTEKERKYDFSRACERDFWENLSAEKRAELVRNAERELEEEIPLLKAADYMKYYRNGNRIDYENPYFRRRHALGALVLGECAEYKGRFLDQIVELLWQILSEPVWCLPAHQQCGSYPLPEYDAWVVDLFAAETAKMLTDVLQLLEPELEKEFLPLIRRIHHEIEERVIGVCEKKEFSWIRGINNWGVWCAFSVNAAAIEVWKDQPQRLAPFLEKHMQTMKRFFDKYPQDGGCDEGPCYWHVAVGMLLNGLEILQRRLGGFEEWINDPKLKNMISFIPRMNICGKWFMGFSDAESSLLHFSRGLLSRCGKLVGCKEMSVLAANLPEPDIELSSFGNRNLGVFESMADLSEELVLGEKCSYNAVDFWPDLQVWIARQNPEDPEKGINCTLKGGHNGQSHNHMDLGHVSLWHNGQPVIIDVGRGIYSKKCFSALRYTCWNLNAQGHNAARFDDMPQALGWDGRTSMENLGDRAICDLSGIFTAENGVSSYVRKVTLDREKGTLELDEEAVFDGVKSIDISFYTPVEPVMKENTLCLKDLAMTCEGIDVASIVLVDWADAKLEKLWGKLWQINLKCKKEGRAAWKIFFSGLQ